MLVENLSYIEFWSLPESYVINDWDFPLTYGDGFTLHKLIDVLKVVESRDNDSKPYKLLNSLYHIQYAHGNDFYIGF